MSYIKKFLRQDRDYFSNNVDEIQQQNDMVLKVACTIYIFILAFFTLHTTFVGGSRMLSLMYYSYDAIHIVLCFFVFHPPIADKDLERRYNNLLRVLFEITLLSFFIIEAVLPFPNQQSIYFPFPIILLSILFVFNLKRAILLICGYVALFVALVFVYKTGDIRINDLYIASGTLISSFCGYLIVSSLRYQTGAAMGRLRYLSTRDTLTGLYNKATFESLCRAYIEDPSHEGGYALLFFDVDRFKQINDRFGHQVGDAVLKSISSVMLESFYEKDFLGRFGGDEFVVFMVDLKNEDDVRQRVSAFRSKVRALSKTLKTDDLSCSVGIAFKSNAPESYSDLLSRADAALYVVKKGSDSSSFAERHFKENAFKNTDATLRTLGEPQDAFDGGRRTIMIVDDNDMNRQVLGKILSAEYDILEAVNGVDALEVLAEEYERVSAVLLDIIMPEMDGYGVLEHMRQDAALSKIPVIVTTGETEGEAEIKALSLGANDFIIKPYRPPIIIHRLQNIINLRETAAMVNSVNFDQLTGLFSKDYFFKKADALIAASPPGSFDMFYCNIERFRLVNELFGEKTGDELLKYFSSLLSKDTSSKGGICGRLGADRFAALVPRFDQYRAEDFEAASKKINEFPISFELFFRCGICPVDDNSTPAITLCDRAMTVCDSIKDKYGVYFAVYDSKFSRLALVRQFVLDGMRPALHENQFVVYYQPKYDLASETISGAEALVRWQHPERGLIPPGEFISIFESNGFITELDTYVWETACRDIRAWKKAGYAVVPVSVNISRADLYNLGLPRTLKNIVDKYSLTPDDLRLEITETAYGENPEQLVEAVNKFRAMGFLVEMDDFGTGYSSLNRLSELPIDTLKLDMSFMTQTSDSRKRSVLGAITSLANQLDLPVVAEGAETLEQVQLLKGIGCGYAQGYYFAKPMTSGDFAALIEHQTT